MKRINSFNIIGLVVALFVTSVVLTSCDGQEFSEKPLAIEKKNLPVDSIIPTTDPDPKDPSQPIDPKADTIVWNNYMGTWHEVFQDSWVETHMAGQHGGENVKEVILDTLHIKYKYEYSLLADTTLYLDAAPVDPLGCVFSSAGKYDYTNGCRNIQGDSVLSVNRSRYYTLNNGVNLYLSTKRLHAWHEMDGILRPYSEPKEFIGDLGFTPSTSEFERNDSIFGVRTNVVTVPLTLGDKKFYASCSIKEIWFVKLKDTPEPSYNVTLNEFATYICASKCKVSNKNWKDCFLFKGKTKVHIVVAHLDSNGGRALSYEVKSIDLSRVAFNSNVNGVIYDSQTSSYIPALITPDNKDKNGWFTEGVIDGRSVTYDPSKAQAIDEGIKNFVDKNTSVPTPFFMGGSSSSTTWHEYKYTSVSWSKYASDTDMITQKVVVKMPTK